MLELIKSSLSEKYENILYVEETKNFYVVGLGSKKHNKKYEIIIERFYFNKSIFKTPKSVKEIIKEVILEIEELKIKQPFYYSPKIKEIKEGFELYEEY